MIKFFRKIRQNLLSEGKTGGIDGQFEFYDENGNLIEYASQFGGNGNEKIIFNLYDSNEIRFIKIRND